MDQAGNPTKNLLNIDNNMHTGTLVGAKGAKIGSDGTNNPKTPEKTQEGIYKSTFGDRFTKKKKNWGRNH